MSAERAMRDQVPDTCVGGMAAIHVPGRGWLLSHTLGCSKLASFMGLFSSAEAQEIAARIGQDAVVIDGAALRGTLQGTRDALRSLTLKAEERLAMLDREGPPR
jgi:hypothetical protein